MESCGGLATRRSAGRQPARSLPSCPTMSLPNRMLPSAGLQKQRLVVTLRKVLGHVAGNAGLASFQHLEVLVAHFGGRVAVSVTGSSSSSDRTVSTSASV